MIFMMNEIIVITFLFRCTCMHIVCYVFFKQRCPWIIHTFNKSGHHLDLLQVNLLASGVSLFWAQSVQLRATKSREVDLSRLKGTPFAFRAKNGEWRDSHLGFQVSFASPWLQWRNVLIPLRLNLLNVCVYLHHRRSKLVYFVRKLSLTMILGESWRPRVPEKNKTLFQSRVNTGKGDLQWLFFLSNTLCRNCAD